MSDSPTEPAVPMCERWAASRADLGIITAFLDALEEKGVFLCQKTVDEGDFHEYARIYERDIEKLYMEYVDVDPKKLEDERRMLVQRAHDACTP